MSSPTFKHFVGLRRMRTKEDRNVTDTVHRSEASGNFFLSTASWPELPKSQNAHKHSHNHQRTSNATEEKIACDVYSTCKQNCTSVKSQKEFSGSSITEEEQVTKIGATLVATHSVEKHAANYSLDNSRKDQTFRLSSNSDQNGSTGIESNDLPNCTSSDGRRRNQAKKKSMLKEEKKRMREAEILRKRIEPKGQSVKVISHKLLEIVLKSNKDSISVNTHQTCDIGGLNFPTLEEATKKTKNKIIKECSSCCPENSEDCATENTIVNTVTSKKNKHKKPLEIDIHNLIKDSSRKSSDKGYRRSKEQAHLKAKQNVPYIGNQLDSSNPERKRGKKRERPKKKRFTLLKTAILEARAIRKHLRELEEQSKNDAEPTDVKYCNNEFNEPVKTGVQHTQNLSFEVCEHKEETLKCEAIEKENINKKVSVADVAKIELDFLQDMFVSRLSLSGHDKDCASSFQHSESLNENLLSKAAPKNSKENKPVLDKVQLSAQKFLQHSRKFREYCDHILTKELNNAVENLVENIVKFQDRLYQRDPIKAFAKRRYVVGFREVKKHLQLKRLKLVIIAPDLEVAKTKGGTDDAVAELKDMANLQSLPYVFALNRRILGRITAKKVGVSCIGVINYEGAENSFAAIIEAMSVARMEYNKLVNNDTAVIPEKEESEETKGKVEISACIAASLLAKLREKPTEDETQIRDKSSPFLAAIDRVIKSEDSTDCQK